MPRPPRLLLLDGTHEDGPILRQADGRSHSQKQALKTLIPISIATASSAVLLGKRAGSWLASGGGSPYSVRPAISGDAAPMGGLRFVRTDGDSLHVLYRRCRIATPVRAQKAATGLQLRLR